MWGEKEKTKNSAGFAQEFYTFLGKGVDFRGKAEFEGTVRVDGNFEGEITIDDTLIIGENALIKGTIIGGTIVSSGRIEGVITASKKIQLLKPAVLIGDIQTPTFAMEEGVYFQGECDMGVAPKAEKPESDLEEKITANGQVTSEKLETEPLSF